MSFLRLLFLAFAVLCAAPAGAADTYPSRALRWVVPYPPAGTTDILARIMAVYLSEHLGQQVVIDNRPGAANNIGTELVVKAPPDGYTLLLVNPANAINATLYPRLNFDFLRDIAPVAGLVRVPNVMEVTRSLPPKTVPEFIAYVKANPGKVILASSGIGTSVPSGHRRDSSATRESSSSRDSSTRDCRDAHAPICDVCAREWKYGSLSSVVSGRTLPSTVT